MEVPKYKYIVPILGALIVYLLPVPEGLTPSAMGYLAVFFGVVLALILEPIPPALAGLLGVVIIALFQFVVPEGATGNPATISRNWALGGFSNGVVWLIFAAFMFAKGYQTTGLGKRVALVLIKKLGKSALGLGYAIGFSDLVLAPFIPSNTARSAGTLYPVIKNIPEMYGSTPDNEPRKIGSYLMWVALATTCVTSSMFYTALAPNLLALPMMTGELGIEISWGTWLLALLPVTLLLLLLVPIITYLVYPPTQNSFPEASSWADKELKSMGPISSKEIIMLLSASLALVLWIFGGRLGINSTTVALLALSIMLLTGVLNWKDVVGNKEAWNIFIWFATLVSLAGGLRTIGFLSWLGGNVSGFLEGFSITSILVYMTIIFFVAHYFFASVTAHVTALLPIFISIALNIQGMPLPIITMLLCGSLGLMGILTPYGTGPSPAYFGSGYIESSKFWVLGGIFGFIYLTVLLIIGLPYLLIFSSSIF